MTLGSGGFVLGARRRRHFSTVTPGLSQGPPSRRRLTRSSGLSLASRQTPADPGRPRQTPADPGRPRHEAGVTEEECCRLSASLVQIMLLRGVRRADRQDRPASPGLNGWPERSADAAITRSSCRRPSSHQSIPLAAFKCPCAPASTKWLPQKDAMPRVRPTSIQGSSLDATRAVEMVGPALIFRGILSLLSDTKRQNRLPRRRRSRCLARNIFFD